jgi:ligand-binding sensor domain-containing protein
MPNVALISFRWERLPNTIADNRITKLYESSDGRIWIGTEGSGLLYFDPSTNKFGIFNHPFFDAGKCGSIFALHEVSKNKLLVGSTHGLYLIPDVSAQKPDVKTLQIKSGVRLRIRNIWAEDNSIIWIGTQSGAFRVLISEQNKLKVLFTDNSDRYVYGVTKIKPGIFAIYGKNGIDFYNVAPDGFQLLKSNYQLFPSETVISMKKHSNLWFIATHNNIFNWNGGSDNPLPFVPANMDFFKNNILQEIFIDKGNILWITSRNKGVAQIDLNAPKFYEYPLPDKDLFVKSLLILSDNRKAIGIKDYGLLIETSPGSDKFKLMFSGRTVPNMLEDSRKNIWIVSQE